MTGYTPRLILHLETLKPTKPTLVKFKSPTRKQYKEEVIREYLICFIS